MPNKKLSTTHEVNHALMTELEFKAVARRNKLLGYWLGDMMGLDEAAAEDYAIQVVYSDLEEPGDEDVIRKVMADIGENNLDVSEEKIRQELDHLIRVARGQIEDESQ